MFTIYERRKVGLRQKTGHTNNNAEVALTPATRKVKHAQIVISGIAAVLGLL